MRTRSPQNCLGRPITTLCGWLLMLCCTSLPAQPAPVIAPIPVSPFEQGELLEFLGQHGGGVLISEGLMQKLVGRENVDEGAVRDQVLGADVVGTQSTRARTEFDFYRQPDHAAWYVHLRGVTRNQTTSYTPQAVIRSQGDYRFQLTKQVDYQGDVLQTRSPAAFMETHQRNLAAHTRADNIPLVGPLVGMAAFVQAEQNRPLAERIAADRLTRRIAPEFNGQIDIQLANLNGQLKLAGEQWPTVLGPVPRITSRSTDQFGVVALAPGLTQTQAVPPWADVVPSVAGVSLLLTQNRANQLLDKLPIKGLELRDGDVDLFLKRLTVGGLGPALPSGESPTSLATLILDSTRPLSVEFLASEVMIELRSGLRPTLGADIPVQRIRFGITSEETPESVTLNWRIHDIQPDDPQLSVPAHDLIREVLKQQIKLRLQPVTIPREIPLPERVANDQFRKLRLEHLQSQSGWLVIKVSG